MVVFFRSDSGRPFVMGGKFQGQVGLEGRADNRVKSIQIRSGHRIVFTEDESIIITDKSGNEIHLDTTGSNINITAPETMTLNCKNMNINVGENMTTNVGMNASEMIGMNKSTSATMNTSEFAGMNMWKNATLDYSLNATNILKMASENYSYEANDIHKNASEGIEVSASSDIVQNSEKCVHNLSGEKGYNA